MRFCFLSLLNLYEIYFISFYEHFNSMVLLNYINLFIIFKSLLVIYTYFRPQNSLSKNGTKLEIYSNERVPLIPIVLEVLLDETKFERGRYLFPIFFVTQHTQNKMTTVNIIPKNKNST